MQGMKLLTDLTKHVWSKGGDQNKVGPTILFIPPTIRLALRKVSSLSREVNIPRKRLKKNQNQSRIREKL
jgi:hypothetical protein